MQVLQSHDFTGKMEDRLKSQMGRSVNPQLSDLGRNLFFDKILSLKGDNACAGCHAPSAGFSDTQPIAIGIDNNNIVGRKRKGPRNQRRTPTVVNTAFFPNLMWNSRFIAVSNNPFDNSQGFIFPPPESESLSYLPHLLNAQAFIPPTERIEMAGFHFVGDNNAIRAEVVRRLNASEPYRQRFAEVFGALGEIGITYDMLAAAIAEFEIGLSLTNAPIDRFARGNFRAMSTEEKEGALLFFGKANCVSCHAVSGRSNEMFSDFETHVAGIPQVIPMNSNASFDGPGANEDFGGEQFTGNTNDRYKFRTSPLRNVALQPNFFHNGAFRKLDDAIRYHLDAKKSIQTYKPEKHLPKDFSDAIGPMATIMERLDPRLKNNVKLTEREVQRLVTFVGVSLLDPRATRLESLIPGELVSGLEPLEFHD